MSSEDDPKSVKEERIRRIIEQFERTLRRRWNDDPQSYDEIEDEAQEVGEQVKRIIEEERSDACGTGYVGSRLRCRCGGRAKYKGLRIKEVISRSGVHRLHRAYYYCASCRGGWCPLDSRLKLTLAECTGRVRSLAARFCSYLPYQLATDELEVVCGIRLATSTVKGYAQSVGRSLQEHWKDLETLLNEGRALESAKRPSHLHVAMDGVFVFIDGGWHEVKLGCVYRRSPGGGVASARYYATTLPSVKFGPRMRTLAYEEGAENCRHLAVLGDGIPWIWMEANKYFSRRVQILDFYHVTQHLWQVANARFGSESDQTKAWMADQKNCLLNNHASRVIADISTWKTDNKDNCELKIRTLNYLQGHLSRMQYQTFDANGFHIGSGVIEAGCKAVVQARMKGAGMRWKSAGAEAQLHLCAHWRSNPKADFAFD